MTLDINTVVRKCDCGCTPKWLGAVLTDLDEVTTGTFRVNTIGLRKEQIERVETWARKQLARQASEIARKELDHEAIKVTPFKLKERRNQILAALRWTTYNNTPVHVAGQQTR